MYLTLLLNIHVALQIDKSSFCVTGKFKTLLYPLNKINWEHGFAPTTAGFATDPGCEHNNSHPFI